MKKFDTKTLVITAMLAAVAGVLMSLEFPLPLMPPFYKVDFSDVPAVIALFSLGPVPAAVIEIVKLLVKLVLSGTTTAYVGEVANLIGIIMFVIPIWAIYRMMGKTDKAMKVSLIASLPIRIGFSCCINAFITLPMYAVAMGMDINAIVQMVSSANPLIKSLPTFIILATIPFNFIKNSLNYIVGYALFKALERSKAVKLQA